MNTPTNVRANLAASLASRGFTAVVALVSVPLVLTRIGYEGYGLVGFYGSLQALILLLDLGLSLTLNRELARLRAIGDAVAMRDSLRTLEIVYWVVGLAVFAVLAPFAPWLARNWLHPVQLPPDTVTQSIVLMLAVVAARWPLTLYSGGLAGMQRQIGLGWVTAVMAVVQNLGAVVALDLIGRRLTVFFGWQLAAGLVHTCVAGILLWRSLPKAPRPAVFRAAILRGVSRFAASTGATSILAVATQHLDKVILSRLLPLEQFGFYSLATVAAGSLYRLIEPVYVVFYPRLTELVASGGGAPLAAFYHRASQIVTLLVIPAAVVLAAFAPEALWLWTHDRAAVANAAPLLTLLAAGTALNGLIAMPYALQLAAGWPQLSLWLNLFALAVAAPAMWMLAGAFGAPGAASVWVLVNAFFLVVAVYLMHRRLLPGERGRWYREDVTFPAMVALAVAIPARLAWQRVPSDGWVTAGILVGVGLATLAATAMTLPAIRNQLRGKGVA